MTTDTTEIQRLLKNTKNYANKLDNLEIMDKFLEIHYLPRLNKQETENLNRPITTNKIESVIKKIPQNKVLG